ncbi:MAG: BLUF domain-containing protein [Ahrensia sp.]|nr:BLUF domain-containing protein [Ahrensia sp.]
MLPHVYDNDNGGLVRLVYRSRAMLPGNWPSFHKLVLAAGVVNNTIGVTGAITFDGFEFVQVLEGESDVVNELMEKISNDPRHEDIKIVSEKRVPMRRYSGWALKTIHRDDHKAFVLSLGA